MKFEDTEASLEREYLEAAQRRSDLMRQNEPELANREYDKLYELKQRMRELPDKGEAALKRITTSTDYDIQILAAADILALDENYALQLLERIARQDVGLPSFTAEMTLQEWKSGALREYLK